MDPVWKDTCFQFGVRNRSWCRPHPTYSISWVTTVGSAPLVRRAAALRCTGSWMLSLGSTGDNKPPTQETCIHPGDRCYRSAKIQAQCGGRAPRLQRRPEEWDKGSTLREEPLELAWGSGSLSTQSLVHGPATAAASGSLINMQMLGPHLSSKKTPGDSCLYHSFGSTMLEDSDWTVQPWKHQTNRPPGKEAQALAAPQ